MKWFKASKPLLTWREPVLFAARTRDRRGWLLRGLLALVIFAAMMVGFSLDKGGPRRAKFPMAAAVTLSAVIGLFLTAVLEAPDLHREATIYEDRICSFGNAGQHSSMTTWRLADLIGARLIPPEELGRSFGALELVTRKGLSRVGVTPKMPMHRIAEVLHARGVDVVLPGWSPGSAEAGPPADEIPAEPKPLPTTSARVERLGEGEAGQILTPARFRIGLAMVLAPLVATVLPGLGLVGYAAVRHFVLGGHAGPPCVAFVGGGLALVVFGFWLTGRFANLAPMLYLRAAARSVVELRPEAPFNARDPEVVFVDVIPRANWGKAMAKNFSDCGLLKVDPVARSVLFEGDHERWRIPAASLISAEVESYRPAGSIEGQEGEVYYVTTIRANVGGEAWEAPVAKCHVEFRPKDNALREANARALSDQIRALQPAARPAVV